MKKVLSILLALVMVVLCFAACGNTQDADQGDKTQTATIAAIPKDKLKIGVIHIGAPAIPTRMISAFRACRKISAFPMIRLFAS